MSLLLLFSHPPSVAFDPHPPHGVTLSHTVLDGAGGTLAVASGKCLSKTVASGVGASKTIVNGQGRTVFS